MTSSEDLVPRGLPQGSRQETEAAMQAAGLPLGSASAGAGLAVAPPPAAPAPGAVPARQQTAGFDVFADRTPNPVPPPPSRDVIFAQVQASDNAVLQDIFSRMPGYKEG